MRIVVPSAIRQLLLLQLHRAHVGSARMRKLAHRHIWWPGIDRDIDKMVRNCDACALHRNSLPTVPLHLWEFPDRPWQCFYLHFAGPFKNFMWLIVVDAHSKWPEDFKFQVGSSGTKQVISSSKHLIASFGIPKQIVTDNGPQFVAKEFQDFCNQQGIFHSLTPPYHPKSNGHPERFIQPFKRAVRKGLETPEANLQDVVTDFLMVYRSTEHNTTGESPSKLLLDRELRCSLDMLAPELPAHPDQTKQLLKCKVQECQERQKKRHDRTSHERKLFQ